MPRCRKWSALTWSNTRHFTWNESASLEWNLYQFHDKLRLYGSFCRRWEGIHNGSCCVVERVRDTYLMPKIREFTARMGLEGQALRRDVQDEESPTEVGLELLTQID